MTNETLPRDIFIEEIEKQARIDRRISIVNADLGAKALDSFRKDLPGNFKHVGIAEQYMVDYALGRTLAGKIPYCYAMDAFVLSRTTGQLKCAGITFDNEKERLGKYPDWFMNIVGVGHGFGYGNAGPTHYTTELGWARDIAGLEILLPSDSKGVSEAARISHTVPGLRYIGLDREFLEDIPRDNSFFEDGLGEIIEGKDVCIFSTGYTTHTALEARRRLAEKGIYVGVVDIFRINPFNEKVALEISEKYNKIITVEEHFKAGGIGEMLSGVLGETGSVPVKKMFIPEKYFFENARNREGGSRKLIHGKSGIDAGSIVKKVMEL